MDLYSTALICFTILLGLAIVSGAGIVCFRVFIRFEERASIREQETIAHKARLYAEKDISKSYLENMASTFGMYPPEDFSTSGGSESGYEALVNFISTPQGQEILKKLGINLNGITDK